MVLVLMTFCNAVCGFANRHQWSTTLLVFIPCILLYVHERPTNALILFKVYSLSYLLLHVSASSMPSSGSLHVPTELLVPSESLLIKFCTMDRGGF
jgi:hypothetical protein